MREAQDELVHVLGSDRPDGSAVQGMHDLALALLSLSLLLAQKRGRVLVTDVHLRKPLRPDFARKASIAGQIPVSGQAGVVEAREPRS